MEIIRASSSGRFSVLSFATSWFHILVLASVTCSFLVIINHAFYSSIRNDPLFSGSRPSSRANASIARRCGDIEKNLNHIACCGHRGFRSFAPENTLSSFMAAIKVGANCVEFDVHRTRDGELLVAHGRSVRDNLLNSSKSSQQRIETMDSKFLKGLDSGSWFSSNFSSERILSLQETISKLWSFPVLLVIDLKYEKCRLQPRKAPSKEKGCFTSGEWEKLYAESLLQSLIQNFNSTQSQKAKLGVIFASFNRVLIDIVAQKFKQEEKRTKHLKDWIIGLAYIIGQNDTTSVKNWNKEVTWVAPHYSLVEKIEPLHRNKRRIASWVTDGLPVMQNQIKLGASTVITNYPSLCPELCTISKKRS